MKKIIIVLVSISVLIIAAGFIWIFLTVKNTCDLAKEKYGGKCPQALVVVLEDEKSGPKEKNDAIWALGQMADPEYQGALEKLYAGKVPEGREPLDKVVSQYELEKALRWMKKGNITSWMYGCLKK